jgi:hypothetical protein
MISSDGATFTFFFFLLFGFMHGEVEMDGAQGGESSSRPDFFQRLWSMGQILHGPASRSSSW